MCPGRVVIELGHPPRDVIIHNQRRYAAREGVAVAYGLDRRELRHGESCRLFPEREIEVEKDIEFHTFHDGVPSPHPRSVPEVRRLLRQNDVSVLLVLAHERIDHLGLFLLDVYVSDLELGTIQPRHGTLEILNDGVLPREIRRHNPEPYPAFHPLSHSRRRWHRRTHIVVRRRRRGDILRRRHFPHPGAFGNVIQSRPHPCADPVHAGGDDFFPRCTPQAQCVRPRSWRKTARATSPPRRSWCCSGIVGSGRRARPIVAKL
jgi:hypothetical protein